MKTNEILKRLAVLESAVEARKAAKPRLWVYPFGVFRSPAEAVEAGSEFIEQQRQLLCPTYPNPSEVQDE